MGHSNERTPMKPGEYEFGILSMEEMIPGNEFYGRQDNHRAPLRIRVNRLISDEGVTCMVYEGILPSNGRKVIMKEFYPYSNRNVWGIRRSEGEDQKLQIPSMVWKADSEIATEIMERFRQFIRSYDWQRKFNADSQFLEVVVEPHYLAVYGDTYYIISDYHNGQSMTKKVDRFKNLKDKIYLFQYLADVMSVFAENKYLFLDICEGNFLVIQQTKSRYQLRLFDMDSIIDMSNIDNLHQAEGNIFFHEEYASKEIRKLEQRLKRTSFDEIKKDYLEESVMVYSLGVLFFKVLFAHIPTDDERKMEGEYSRLAGYLAESYNVALETAEKLLDLLKRMLSDQYERYQSGVSTCSNVLKELNDFADEMNYETYISKKEMAEANATFAAYNMLQNFPLFYYADGLENGSKVLKAALMGSHIMRAGFLSAVISIGQMLDAKLEISIVSNDAKAFWNDYVSEGKNAALKKAVVVEEQDPPFADEVDLTLVNRPLAYVHIITVEPEEFVSRLYGEEHYRYFIFLDEERKVLRSYHALEKSVQMYGNNKVCAGCLQTGRKSSVFTKDTDMIDIHYISGLNSSEVYNEKMYEERIYKMGLMAHAYYCGYLIKKSKEDMEKLEKEYKTDIYSRMSSERAALHGIYKMASVGVDVNQPGRFRAYFEKMADEQIVESLGWLEHLSWTAYMLTTGHCPVSVQEMDYYAYRYGNDWKDKRNPNRIRHPLLVSSLPDKKLPDNGWQNLSMEEIAELDALDTVSYEIYRWYCRQKCAVRERFLALFEENTEIVNEKNAEIFKTLKECGMNCIEHVGEKQKNQDASFSANWKQALKELELYVRQDEELHKTKDRNADCFLKKVNVLMKPVIDSYNPRDFKQFDRDIVYSVLDLIVV